MALRADQIQLRIDIELQNAINKIGLLENEISDLNHSFLALKGNAGHGKGNFKE
jgi:hypothetical protein